MRKKSGKEFQTWGAVKAKLRSPSLLKCVTLGLSFFWDDDLKFLIGTYSSTKLERYSGARPLIHLKQSTAIL